MKNGEWVVNKDCTKVMSYSDDYVDGEIVICYAPSRKGKLKHRGRGNLDVLSASIELLKACGKALDTISKQEYPCQETISQLKEAINKATNNGSNN